MKRILSTVVAVLLLIVAPPVSRAAAVTTYYVGDVVVTIDRDSKTLTASGSGEIPDYSSAAAAPWYADAASETVVIEDGITSIGKRAFSANSATKKVVVSGSVKKIGSSAFSNNPSLAEVSLGGVEKIDEYAFYNCASLERIDLPDSLSYIGSSALSGCTSLEKVDLPDNLEYFSGDALTDTKLYKSLPAGLSTLEGYTLKYKGTFSGDELSIPEGTKMISAYTLADTSALKSVTIPSSVTAICERAFYNDPSLKSVTIPDSVTSIGNFAVGYRRDSTYSTPSQIEGFKITGHGGTAAEKYASLSFFDFECLHVAGGYSFVPDCAEGGEAMVACAYCGETLYTEDIAPREHKFDSEIKKAATCTEDGFVGELCSVCGATEIVETIPATGHRPNLTSPVVTPPGCTSRGSISHVCTVCGEACGDVIYIAPTGHTEGDETVVTPPGCTEDGLSEIRCTVCGELLKTVTTPATGHRAAERRTILSLPVKGGADGLAVRLCTVCKVATEYVVAHYGDVDADGVITSTDVVCMKRTLANNPIDKCVYEFCDLDTDGTVTSGDLVIIKRLIAS